MRSAQLIWVDEYNAPNISGQKLLIDNEIWDFNQCRVKQLGKGFAAGTETAHISVVTISRKGVIDRSNIYGTCQ